MLVGADVCACERGFVMHRLWLAGLLGVWLTACSEPDMGNFKPGMVHTCQAMPAFIAQTGLGAQVAIDTQQRGFTGIRLLNPKSKATWQHPSWDDAGHTGAFVRDNEGNIYVAPTPEVSLAENPPALQNRIYRVDAKTGEMVFWLELPAFALPSSRNPFGVMGLFYDCDTNSLYASSLAGSSAKEAQGRIYQIDVSRKTIVSHVEKVDAIGIGVFNGVQHKRLYFGSARSSDVFSVALDAKGHFTKELRHETALATLPDGNSTSVRKFEFARERQGQYIMQLKETEFGFRLLAENNPRRRTYHFIYRVDSDSWQFRSSQLENALFR